eukprot:365528_1
MADFNRDFFLLYWFMGIHKYPYTHAAKQYAQRKQYYSMPWLMERLENVAKNNSIYMVLYRVLIPFSILLHLSQRYLYFVWFNVVSTASMYCFYKNGKWWDCFVDSFTVQDTLVWPQSHDWRMIVVLLAIMF